MYTQKKYSAILILGLITLTEIERVLILQVDHTHLQGLLNRIAC